MARNGEGPRSQSWIEFLGLDVVGWLNGFGGDWRVNLLRGSIGRDLGRYRCLRLEGIVLLES